MSRLDLRDRTQAGGTSDADRAELGQVGSSARAMVTAVLKPERGGSMSEPLDVEAIGQTLRWAKLGATDEARRSAVARLLTVDVGALLSEVQALRAERDETLNAALETRSYVRHAGYCASQHFVPGAGGCNCGRDHALAKLDAVAGITLARAPLAAKEPANG